MGRNVQSRGFHVLPSYYEAIRDLPDKERFPLYDALFDYGFEGAEPENLSPVGQAIFSLIRPGFAGGKNMAIPARSAAPRKIHSGRRRPRDMLSP